MYEESASLQTIRDRDALVESLGGFDLTILFPREDGSMVGRRPREAFRRGSSAFLEPTQGFGLGLGSIVESRDLLAIFLDPESQPILQQIHKGPVTEDCPASLLALHPNPVLVHPETPACSSFSRPNPSFDRGVDVLEENDLPAGVQVLFLCPHPDDASISAGGSLFLLAERGPVTVILLSSGHRADLPGSTIEERATLRREELEQECRELGVEWIQPELEHYDQELFFSSRDAARLAEIFREMKPGIVMIPSAEDRHPTHRTCHHLATEGLRRAGEGVFSSGVEIWEYEGPWHLFGGSEGNLVVPLPERASMAKDRAILCHRTQVARSRYDRAARGLAQYRAATLPETRLTGFGRSCDLGGEVEFFRRKIPGDRT